MPSAQPVVKLNRTGTLDELHAREQELKTLLDLNMAVARHLKRDDLFGALASSLRNVIETDRLLAHEISRRRRNFVACPVSVAIVSGKDGGLAVIKFT